MITNINKVERLYRSVLKYPKTIIVLSILAVIAVGSQLSKMKIDTTIEAFIPSDHPSLINRNEVREIFGLSDPIVVAIVNNGTNGVFTPELLNFTKLLTEKIELVEGVDPEGVTSLSTENNIYGTETGLIVDPFIDGEIQTQESADKIRGNVLSFPLYVGNLVSEDATTTLIVTELLDKNKYGKQAYKDIDKLAKEMLAEYSSTSPNAAVHIAGEGGVIAHLAEYIDGDAKKMTPLAFLVILLIVGAAYRTFRGLYLSVFVLIGSVVTAMGIMAAAGVPMYLSSNVIPVILITISVADAIHILGEYYETIAKYPEKTSKEIVILTMKKMFRPVFFTSITNVAGFLAMGYTSNIPPLQAMGLFSSVGVVAALIFSLFSIPAVLVLRKPKLSKAYKHKAVSNGEKIQPDIFGRIMGRIGNVIISKSRLVLGITAIAVFVGVFGASRMYLDEASIDNFNPSTSIYKADKLINTKMDGSNSFDVMIKTKNEQGFYKPQNLQKIIEMQNYLEGLPFVGGTTSIVDIIKQMNKSLNENKDEFYTVPDNEDMVAQLFLLYSASGDPADLEQFIDYDYTRANIAVTLKSGYYSDTKEVIEPLNEYIAGSFNNDVVEARVAGWMNVFFYWIDGIKFSHFMGVGVAVFFVWLLTAISFKSVITGLYTVTPVVTALFIFYAVMGFFDITLNSATTMFGAIAIGVAVDFSIHVVEFLINATKKENATIDSALKELYPSTGRALLFSVAAVCLGFGVNMTSSIPPFVTFGALISTCVASSFIASITLLPAMVKVFKPKFATQNLDKSQSPNYQEELSYETSM